MHTKPEPRCTAAMTLSIRPESDGRAAITITSYAGAAPSSLALISSGLYE